MLLDLKEDIREECEKLGDVTNVVLFDGEEDGVVSVRFANTESAKACVRVCFAICLPIWDCCRWIFFVHLSFTNLDLIVDEWPLLCRPES